MRLAISIATSLALLAACREEPTSRPPGAAVGDVRNGQAAIGEYGCGSCHTIPGIEGADSLVGPPLTSWAARSFIAGTLANNQENLVIWLRGPQSVRPGTAMPDLDVTVADAEDISAYLLSLE